MAGLCEDGNEPPGSLKAICKAHDDPNPPMGSERCALYSSIDIMSYVLRLASSVVIASTNFARYFLGVKEAGALTCRHIVSLLAWSVLKKHGGGCRTFDEMVANVQAAYERSPRKSLRRASRELQVPKSTLERIDQKRLKLYAYKVQLMQRLEPDDKSKRVEFASTMLDRLGADPDFISKIFFSDEATFHVSDKVNRHNVRIWGSQNPQAIQEHVRDSPKLNMWWGLSQQPPRSPDLTPLDFFLWGYVKDKEYAIPVRDLRDLREHIIEAIESIPEDMLQRAGQEIVHRLDIVTVTAGAQVEIWRCAY
ncbi:hypothetical protein ANN_01097 [Periplaneta americana]|uniref:Uncharacterized protein n=1 Tax=Periplaneta americana TaxID=6978 RepID=A0ABQ8TTR0_PERAM|nr:hypothetical protein ANN_01097 [Periplaneta americana]